MNRTLSTSRHESTVGTTRSITSPNTSDAYENGLEASTLRTEPPINIQNAISGTTSTSCRTSHQDNTTIGITSSSNILDMYENELDESKLRIKSSSTYGTQSSLKVVPFTNFYTPKSTLMTGRYDYIVQSSYQLSEFFNNSDEAGFERVINDLCLEDCVVMTTGLVKPKIGRQYYTDACLSFVRNTRDRRHVITKKRIISNGPPSVKFYNTVEGQCLSIKNEFN